MNRVLGCIVAVSFLMVPTSSDACSCRSGLPLCETVLSADAVFEGTVELIETLTFEEEIGGRLTALPQKHVRFAIS